MAAPLLASSEKLFCCVKTKNKACDFMKSKMVSGEKFEIQYGKDLRLTLSVAIKRSSRSV